MDFCLALILYARYSYFKCAPIVVDDGRSVLGSGRDFYDASAKVRAPLAANARFLSLAQARQRACGHEKSDLYLIWR